MGNEKLINLVLRNQESRKRKKKYAVFQKYHFIRLGLWNRSVLINWKLHFKMSMVNMTFSFLNWPWNSLVSSYLMTGHVKQSLSRKITRFEVLHAHHLCFWPEQTRKRVSPRDGRGHSSWGDVLLPGNYLGEKCDGPVGCRARSWMKFKRQNP